MTNIKIAIAQLNYIVGDFEGNTKKILEARDKAASEGAELVVYSELCISGYPPEDLVLRKGFQNQAKEFLDEITKATKEGPALLVSNPHVEDDKIYNAAFLLAEGEIKHKQYKFDLPNYGVFDEKRVFDAGKQPKPFEYKGIKFGLMICEDMWHGRVIDSVKTCDILLSVNASPFEVGKHDKRVKFASAAAKTAGKPLIYVNQICGHDDLVFDGDSFVLSKQGEYLARLSRHDEEVRVTNWAKGKNGWVCEASEIKTYTGPEQVMYQALMLGLKEYVEKNNFPGVVLGMSGGIDSALTAAICVDALGSDKVRLVMMPSRYTSNESLKDAEECANALGVTLENLPIEDIFRAYEDTLAPTFDGKEADLTEENLQSRIRGALLMAISNKFGNMVVATGNKSEMSVGYATLYGDMCGGYSVLKDVYKTQVFELAKWRNKGVAEGAKGKKGVVIPKNIITKAPTAELRHEQKDEDSLPPYDVLDDILDKLIEKSMCVAEAANAGHDIKLVEKVLNMVQRAEYKRRQSPPGVKVSAKPFGRDRRYPITSGYKG